jgi:hypothetical protein
MNRGAGKSVQSRLCVNQWKNKAVAPADREDRAQLCTYSPRTASFIASTPRLASRAPPQASWWSLKKQFKSVFHNVSTVIDCVACQKCRLHAKVTMLGFGAALKMLLLPHELIQVHAGVRRGIYL